MYNEVEKYIIECIKLGKKRSGKKVSTLKEKHEIKECKPLVVLYAAATENEIPSCENCKDNKVYLVSLKKGFSKYCSKTCRLKALSNRNKENNAELNKLRAEKIKKSRENLLIIGEKEYVKNENTTIREVANRLGLPIGALREHLNQKNLVDKKRQTKIYRDNLHKKLAKAYQYLNDKTWVYDKINIEKWTSKTFAEELGCSKDFVCYKLRSNGIYLSDYTHNVSSYEEKISKFLNELSIDYIRNDRKILKGRELDIYIPSRKLAIEINGIYWHQYNENVDNKNYHLEKTEKCENESIRLLHITDKEIDNKFSLIQGLIKSSLGLNDVIYARKCHVKEISSSVFRNFVSENHLQGNINSSTRYGLFYKDEMVSVMGFAKSRFNKNFQYEITRFCCKAGVTVVGGASKMFKHFIKYEAPISVISYCERRLFTGRTYEKIGMSFSHDSPPNYVWVHNHTGETLSRYKTQKHLLKDCKENMTETDYMKSSGYMKIYDSGQKVYTWHAVRP